MTHASGSDGSHQLVIEPTRGTFQGQVQARSYELRIHATDKPSSISVNGRDAGPWTWEAEQATAVVVGPSQPIRERISVAWRGEGAKTHLRGGPPSPRGNPRAPAPQNAPRDGLPQR